MRLIDADKLVYDEVNWRGRSCKIIHASDIDNAPNAFDFDKVRGQMENLQSELRKKYSNKNLDWDFYLSLISKSLGVDRCLEILKAGMEN